MASAIRPGTHASPRHRPFPPPAAHSRAAARLAQPILLLITALLFGSLALLTAGCNPERMLSPMPEPPERTLVLTVMVERAGGASREVELGHLTRAEDIEAALASLPAASRAELLATGSCVIDDPEFRRTVTRLVDGSSGVRGVHYSDINGTTWGKVKARFLPT